MPELERVSFSHFGDSPIVVEGGQFERRLFHSCSLGPPSAPRFRSLFRNLKITQCAQDNCTLRGAILDSVSVTDLGRQGRSPLFLSGVAFRHCVLAGRISLFKLNAGVRPAATPKEEAPWLAANRAFYQEVDWALDISAADFTFGPDIHFVPGSLVRRDPRTQALVRRENATRDSLKRVQWEGSSLKVALSWFLQHSPYADVVLVAARRSAGFEEDMRAIAVLRDLGIAEAE